MSRWQHGITHKKVINLDHDGDRHVCCAWDECEKDGVDLHMVRVNYGKNGTPHVVKHIFCTERHRQYWINSTRAYGQLPPGFRRSFILQWRFSWYAINDSVMRNRVRLSGRIGLPGIGVRLFSQLRVSLPLTGKG